LLATFELNRLGSHLDRLLSIGLFLRGRTTTTTTEDHLGGFGRRGLLACGDASKYVLVSLALHRLDSIRLACGSLLLVSRLFLFSCLVFPLTALVFCHAPCTFKLGLMLLGR